VRLSVEVQDADLTVSRAVTAGATLLLPVQDMFWGARYGKLLDPYGHEWGINQQLRRLDAAQEADEARRFFAER